MYFPKPHCLISSINKNPVQDRNTQKVGKTKKGLAKMGLKRKHDELQQESFYGHGKNWFRGDIIRKTRFGSIYLATLKKPKRRLTNLPTLMAVKSADVSDSALLQKEAMVLNNFQDCPYIRKCYGEEITTSDSNGMIYNLLFEHASGGTLADLIKKSGGTGLPQSDVSLYARYVLKGLECIHKHGYAHCDLKPESILLFPFSTTNSGKECMAKIGDIGLAKRIKMANKKILDPCCFRGKVGYLSPEVVVSKSQEAAIDIWALGCVVMEMITGKSLWDGKKDWEVEDILREIGEEKRMVEIPSEVSKEGKDFLRGCFATKPEDRLTARSLLNHPFVAELDADDVDDREDIAESEKTAGESEKTVDLSPLEFLELQKGSNSISSFVFLWDMDVKLKGDEKKTVTDAKRRKVH